MKAIRLLIAAFVLALMSPVHLEAWIYTDGHFQAAAIPVQGQVLASPAGADLDGDGAPEVLRLSGGQAMIISAGRPAWNSPAGWRVVQARLTDLDHDGRPEATLLVWRPFKPWPIDRYLPHGGRIQSFHDASGMSCHLILIGWRGGGYRELWAGSALVDPLRDFLAVDLDNDGRQELVALESRYDDPAFAPARALSVWEWNGFGFTLLARQPGAFRELKAVDLNDHRLLLITQR